MNSTVKTILTLIGSGTFAVLWSYFIWPPIRSFLNLRQRIEAGKDELHATDQQLLTRAQAQCKELEIENEQLASDLKEETRKVLIREQINAEDTAYIRALTARMRQHECVCGDHSGGPHIVRRGVDYSDIDKEFDRT